LRKKAKTNHNQKSAFSIKRRVKTAHAANRKA
jgi:hypothetical protein